MRNFALNEQQPCPAKPRTPASSPAGMAHGDDDPHPRKKRCSPCTHAHAWWSYTTGAQIWVTPAPAPSPVRDIKLVVVGDTEF